MYSVDLCGLLRYQNCLIHTNAIPEMITLGAKLVLTLAAVVVGFAVAVIKPRYDEMQRQRARERRHAMVYDNPWNDSTTEQNRVSESKTSYLGILRNSNGCRYLLLADGPSSQFNNVCSAKVSITTFRDVLTQRLMGCSYTHINGKFKC